MRPPHSTFFPDTSLEENKEARRMRTTTLTDKMVDKGPLEKRVDLYFETAIERHKVYKRRLAGKPRPWSTNPIFNNYRFCNVYRELDKCTIWLRENWREPYASHPNLAFAMALFRLINWPPTLEEIGFPVRWNPEKALKAINARIQKEQKVYTGAYLLGGGIAKGGDRGSYLVNEVLTPLQKNLIGWSSVDRTSNEQSLCAAWLYFRQHRGIGDFLAYEIVSDLRHTHYLNKAFDIMTWANPGPGALRGLTRLWGYDVKTRKHDGWVFPKNRANEAMQNLLKLSKQKIPSSMPKWEMREVEHWLCETDKYNRIQAGEGVLERFNPIPDGQWSLEDLW